MKKLIILLIIGALIYWFFIRKKKDTTEDELKQDNKSIWSPGGGIYTNLELSEELPAVTPTNISNEIASLSASKKTYLISNTGSIKRSPVQAISLGTVPVGTGSTKINKKIPAKTLELRR